MAVPACGRCVRGGRPRGGVSPPGLPGVRRAAGVLVRVPASCPRGGQVRADLCSPAALRAVRGEPCAAAVVRAGLAAGYGRDGRRGLAGVCGGGCGVRPAAARAGVPYTTARGWVRRFAARAPAIGAAFAALAAELGGPAITGPAGAGRFALAGLGAAFAAAAALPGRAGQGAWRFASAVTGGRLIAANIISPFLIVGSRRFMPPVPP